MKKRIQLFDVDGTLTSSEKDEPFASSNLLAYKTFAFWPLLSSLLAKKPCFFESEAAQWNKLMETTPETQKDRSSFDMMERTVREFLYHYVNAEYMSKKAEEITNNFLIHNVIQLNAIQYINECLDNGIICILTTGSYLDGLKGFVNALIKKNILRNSKNLLLNGAEVNWANKTLIRANVGKYKTENLFNTLKENNIEEYAVQAAFGDDPYINDKAILELALPNGGFVIKCKKNVLGGFNPQFKHCTWQEFIQQHKLGVLSCL